VRRHVVGLIGLAALLAYTTVYTLRLIDTPVGSDGYSYYVYLPSWFLSHDPTLQAVADDCCGGTLPAFLADLQHVAGDGSQAKTDGLTVQRAEGEDFQEEQVEGALDEVGRLTHLGFLDEQAPAKFPSR
jgi:hypothetical protein